MYGTRFIPLVGIAGMLVACAVPDRTVWYAVHGHTPQELRESLNAQRPRLESGPCDGATTWRAEWRWRETSECDPFYAAITMDIQTVLPRWNPPAEADPQMVAAWDRYLLALTEHERGHVQVAREGFRLLVAQFWSAPTCAEAERRGQSVLRTIQRTQDAYDLRTEHGRATGARW